MIMQVLSFYLCQDVYELRTCILFCTDTSRFFALSLLFAPAVANRTKGKAVLPRDCACCRGWGCCNYQRHDCGGNRRLAAAWFARFTLEPPGRLGKCRSTAVDGLRLPHAASSHDQPVTESLPVPRMDGHQTCTVATKRRERSSAGWTISGFHCI